MADDGDWKLSGRPQSTIARNFSASLNDAFGMDNNIEGLAQSVEQKKQAVTSQSQELEALEAKLRETEERLEQRQSSPAGKAASGNSPPRRKAIGGTFSGQEDDRLQLPTPSPLATQLPTSQSVSSSTMSQWRPAALNDSPAMSGNPRYGNAGQSGGRKESRFAE